MAQETLNVVVTAAASPLGRAVVRGLVGRGHHVAGITQGSENGAAVRADGALPIYADITRAGEVRSALQLAKAAVLVHLGARANGFPSKDTTWAADQDALENSVAATLQAAGSSGVKAIVYVSSTFLYGDTHGEEVNEDSARHINAFSKAAAAAEDRVLHHPIPSWILRAGMMYSAQDDGLRQIAAALRQSKGVYLGDAHALQNWVSVADLAAAVISATERPASDQILNITDGVPVSAAGVAKAIATGLGVQAPKNMNPPGFASRYVISEAQERLLNMSAKVSNSRAKAVLDWKPRYADVRAGLEQVLLDWRAGV